MDEPSGEETFRGEARERVAMLVASTFGTPPRRIEDIPAGLGTRRFFRVWLGAAPGLHPSPRTGRGMRAFPDTLVARVERDEDPALRPPGLPPEPALEPLRSVLEQAGLPVVKSYANARGIALLEDVGDTSLEAAAAAGLEASVLEALYREACELVSRLQRIEHHADVPAFERRLDEVLFRYKGEQFVTWALPWARGREATENEARVVREAFAWIASACSAAPHRLAHRDFKAANLHLHAREPEGPDRLVMIDIQGAFLAPPEYDLVCLLRDSHVVLPEPMVVRLQEAARLSLPDAPDPDTFARRFALLTLTRNGKDLARYLYAARERGDERYLRLLPRAVGTLKAAAARAADWHPMLARLADVVASLPEPECER